MQTLTSHGMTLKDLAKVFGVSTATMYRMKEKGELPPHVKIGGQYRWMPETVNKWIAEQEAMNEAA